MEARLTLTSKEVKRATVLAQVVAGQMTVAEAAELLGISERQCWRILARYRREGAAGLVHASRGQPSARRLADEVRQQVVKLAETRYRDYNDQHLTEVLREEHQLAVSRATVRRLRRQAGLASPRKYRRRKGHLRRERQPQAGRLLQCIASIHDWLEGRGPGLALVAAIDDATNEVIGALFREQEDAAGYFLMLQAITRSHGLPLALYADRHTIFQSPAKPTVEQELAGLLPKSQFGRLLDELQIQLMAAHSPQAKGRIERLWQTLQDRLVKELRQAGAATLAQANQVLVAYLPKFNRRFMVAPAQPGSAYRPWPDGLDPDKVFAFRYQRQVTNDHTIALDGHRLQLPPMVHSRSYAKAVVDLYHSLDGRLAVYYQDALLTVFEPAEPGPPRVECFRAKELALPTQTTPQATATAPRPTPKPAPNHPWRNYPQRLPAARDVPAEKPEALLPAPTERPNQ